MHQLGEIHKNFWGSTPQSEESYGFQGTYFLQQLMLGPTVSEQLALDPFGSVIRSLVAGGLGVAAGPPFGGLVDAACVWTVWGFR